MNSSFFNNKWLFESGVFINDPSSKLLGGVSSGYNTKLNKWNFIYNEITGYQVSSDVLMFRNTHNHYYLVRANQSATYLISCQYKDITKFEYGSFPQGYLIDGEEVMISPFTFDSAMIIQGLLDLYAITNQTILLESAVLAGNWLLKMQDNSGFFYAKYTIESEQKYDYGPYFYNDAGCLHAKHSIALLKLYQYTKDKKYENSAKKVCDWVLSIQDSDGAFWVNPSKSHVYTHAHCYTIEGLLFAFNHFHEKKYLIAIQKACYWCINNLDKNTFSLLGTYKCSKWFNSTETFTNFKLFKLYRHLSPRREIAVDATIQTARAIYYYSLITGEDDLLIYANNILTIFIKLVETKSKIDESKDGLTSRLILTRFKNRKSPILATWPVQFYLGALDIQDKFLNKDFNNLYFNNLF